MALQMCSLSAEAKDKIKKLRFTKAKTITAYVLKINKETLTAELEEEFEDTTIEDIAEEIPQQQPRYVALSYPLTHDDGRVSYPLLFVFISPDGCNPNLHMIYAGSKLSIHNETGFPKVVEYRSVEEFTDEAIRTVLKKF